MAAILRAPATTTANGRWSPSKSPQAVVRAVGTSSAPTSHLDELNKAIGRHIKEAAVASSARHLARINRDIGAHIKAAAAAAAAGKLKPKGPTAPKDITSKPSKAH